MNNYIRAKSLCQWELSRFAQQQSQFLFSQRSESAGRQGSIKRQTSYPVSAKVKYLAANGAQHKLDLVLFTLVNRQPPRKSCSMRIFQVSLPTVSGNKVRQILHLIDFPELKGRGSRSKSVKGNPALQTFYLFGVHLSDRIEKISLADVHFRLHQLLIETPVIGQKQ